MIGPRWLQLTFLLSIFCELYLLDHSDVQGSEIPDVTGQLQMFVDARMVESLRNVDLKLHSPVRKETAITFDAPWESPTAAYVTVFQDTTFRETTENSGSLAKSSGMKSLKSSRYRMYYRGQQSAEKRDVACYAESHDGIHWTKPQLGIVEWEGSKQNNIILISIPPDRVAHNFSPFLDTNPEVEEGARYKSIGGSDIDHGLYAFKSADGIHWERMSDNPVLLLNTGSIQSKFDTQNIAFWDTVRGKYLIYFRTLIERRRAIAVAESQDFLHWTHPRPIVVEGEPEQFYTNAVTPYFREPHLLLAFPKRFTPTRQRLPEHPVRGISDAVFLSSRDGFHFNRQFPEALLRPGRNAENWGDRSLMTASGLVPTGPDEMSIYVSEGYRFETSRLTRFSFRTDGIASVHAGAETGEFITKPFHFHDAHKLILNYSTSASGSIQVELQDLNGTPIPGFTLSDAPPLYGDEIAEPYTWRTTDDVSSLTEHPLRLRIVMKDADLFSYRFE